MTLSYCCHRNQAAQFVPTPPRKLCRAMYDFSARNENELSVRRDALLDVLDDSKSWWEVQNEDGRMCSGNDTRQSLCRFPAVLVRC